jgi:hypothetical protein
MYYSFFKKSLPGIGNYLLLVIGSIEKENLKN